VRIVWLLAPGRVCLASVIKHAGYICVLRPPHSRFTSFLPHSHAVTTHQAVASWQWPAGFAVCPPVPPLPPSSLLCSIPAPVPLHIAPPFPPHEQLLHWQGVGVPLMGRWVIISLSPVRPPPPPRAPLPHHNSRHCRLPLVSFPVLPRHWGAARRAPGRPEHPAAPGRECAPPKCSTLQVTALRRPGGRCHRHGPPASGGGGWAPRPGGFGGGR